MNKKIWAGILKAPALLLLIASLLAGVYAAIYNIQDMGWEVPIILGVVIILYGIGSRMEKRHYEELEDTSTPIPERKPIKEEELVVPEDDEEGFS